MTMSRLDMRMETFSQLLFVLFCLLGPNKSCSANDEDVNLMFNIKHELYMTTNPVFTKDF